MTKSVATKALISTLSAAGLFVAGTQVANADTINIAAGDTVSAYAAQYNVSIDDIVKANKLADANLIIAGHSIEIPGATSSATTSSAVADSTVATSSAVADSTVAASSAVASSSATDSSSSSNVDSNVQAPSNVATAASLDTSSVVALAESLTSQSIPYVWGGSSLSGMDCSGLVAYVYANAAGKSLPHYTVALESSVTKKSVSDAQPGDLLFWGAAGSTYHVAIYVGNGQYVAAPQEGQNVSYGTISSYWAPSFAGSVN